MAKRELQEEDQKKLFGEKITKKKMKAAGRTEAKNLGKVMGFYHLDLWPRAYISGGSREFPHLKTLKTAHYCFNC